jgi:TRAP-type C4-dicarboxylate transport system permease small subunit
LEVLVKVDHFNRIVGFIAKLFDRIAQAGVFVMLLILVANILGRKFWKPIYGTFDYVSFICAIVVAFSIPYCALKKGHTQVELVLERFPQRTQGIIDSIIGILSLATFILVTWQCVVYAIDMKRTGELSMTTLLPFYPYIYGIAFGCALLCLVILAQLIKSAVKAVKR